MLRLIWQRNEQKKSKEKSKNKQTSGGESVAYFFFAARRKNGISALCKSSFISCVAPPRFPIAATTESTIFLQ